VAPEGYRVRLLGSTLELTYEGPGQSSPEAADVVAQRYVGLLRKYFPVLGTSVPEEHFLDRSAPPFGSQMTSGYHERDPRDPLLDPRNVAAALKAARNEFLGNSSEEWLKRCYDHLQEARGEACKLNGEPGYEAYKAVEVVVQRFGSEKAADAALGTDVNWAKRVANQPRHIREKAGPPVTGDPVALAAEVVRAYERYLLKQTP
jgi:hypothetical protein